MSNLLKQFQDSSSFYGSNATFIEDLYERYLENPESVDVSWQQHFKALRPQATADTPHSPIVARFSELASQSPGRLAQLQGFTRSGRAHV